MVPDRYADASPKHLLPLGVPQMVLLAQYDKLMPQSLGEAYVGAALQAGDSVRLMVIPNIGHFELANPRASSWSQVEAAIRSLLDGRLPP